MNTLCLTVSEELRSQDLTMFAMYKIVKVPQLLQILQNQNGAKAGSSTCHD